MDLGGAKCRTDASETVRIDSGSLRRNIFSKSGSGLFFRYYTGFGRLQWCDLLGQVVVDVQISRTRLEIQQIGKSSSCPLILAVLRASKRQTLLSHKTNGASGSSLSHSFGFDVNIDAGVEASIKTCRQLSTIRISQGRKPCYKSYKHGP